MSDERLERPIVALPGLPGGLGPRRLADASDEEVLTLVAEGRSNRDIGSEIHIEESTVKTHLKSIFAKLRAESRTEAVTVATRRGLLRQ